MNNNKKRNRIISVTVNYNMSTYIKYGIVYYYS